MAEEKEEVKEEEKKEEVKEEKHTELPAIDKAIAAAARIEAANLKQEQLLIKQEAMMAKLILMGRGEAGAPQAEKKEETPEDYSEKLMAGEVNPLSEKDED